MLNEEVEDSERGEVQAQIHRGSGKGVSIEPGDKSRSEVEDLSSQSMHESSNLGYVDL